MEYTRMKTRKGNEKKEKNGLEAGRSVMRGLPYTDN